MKYAFFSLRVSIKNQNPQLKISAGCVEWRDLIDYKGLKCVVQDRFQKIERTSFFRRQFYLIGLYNELSFL